MTKAIHYLGEVHAGLNIQERQRIGILLLSAVLLGLALYISMLNLAITEEYRKEKILKEARLISQEMHTRDEFLIAKLQEFYDARAAAFISIEQEPYYVSRAANVAHASSRLAGTRAE
ncbi:MAG: hypothetical protein AAB904_00515 [Patescibacteria group bacterium]